ncbi:MAG: hypothetical protein ABJH93_21670, partial [Roseibium sp.]
EPIGTGSNGQPVYLKDIWPSSKEIAEIVHACVTPEMFRERYANVFDGDDKLVSEARRGGLTIMKATRELSTDRQTLTVTQVVHLVDVDSFTNVSVYKRAQ